MEARYKVYELKEKEGVVVFEGTAIECYDFMDSISEEKQKFMWID